MSLDEIELHDARIKDLSVDYTSNMVRVEIEYFPDGENRNRKTATLVFKEVEQLSLVADMVQIKKNSSAGNINYWRVCEESGLTYIYLVDGCLMVRATSVEFA